jgi:hypothetical protein
MYQAATCDPCHVSSELKTALLYKPRKKAFLVSIDLYQLRLVITAFTLRHISDVLLGFYAV